MANAVYWLCFLTSAAAALLLLRGFWRSRRRLLLWSALGFLGLCLNNLALIFDLMVVPEIDLSVARQVPALLGIALLVFGLIWDSD